MGRILAEEGYSLEEMGKGCEEGAVSQENEAYGSWRDSTSSLSLQLFKGKGATAISGTTRDAPCRGTESS